VTVRKVRFGRVAALVNERAGDADFRIGLEAVEQRTGRLLSARDADYQGEGIGFRRGDVLFGKLRPYLAKVWRADRGGAAVGDFHVYRPVTDRVDPDYLKYCLLADSFISPVSSSVYGAKMPRASWDFIRNVEILVPSMDEQRAIADFLDRETAQVDTLIAKQQRLIATLRERRGAVVAHALRAVGTARSRLKYHAAVQTGITLSGDGELSAPEWPYLRVANVQAGRVDLDEVKTIRVTEEAARRSMLRAGDVLMTEGGDIDKLGRGAIWRDEIAPMLHQNHVFAVRPGLNITPEYLSLWLEGTEAREYFLLTAKKTTNLASTNKWTLGNLPIAVPALVEQHAITSFVDEHAARINTLIQKSERLIELSQERRSALITAAVTGQIDVRKAA